MEIPSLEQVLLGHGHPPYTLGEFSNYLENFHCQENLEFMLGLIRIGSSKSTLEVQTIWKEIYYNFLLETSPVEVNLPCKVKSKLVGSNPEFGQVPNEELFAETKKLIFDILSDLYFEYIRIYKKRFSNVPPYLCVELPKSPESITSNDDEIQNITPTLFEPVPHQNFDGFNIDKTTYTRDDAVYTSPSTSPSPVQKRLSDRMNSIQGNNVFHSKEDNSGLLSQISHQDSNQNIESRGSSRQNSTASSSSRTSSRTSSIGSIVDSFINADHINWRRAVKKLKIRRFSNDHQVDEMERKE